MLRAVPDSETCRINACAYWICCHRDVLMFCPLPLISTSVISSIHHINWWSNRTDCNARKCYFKNLSHINFFPSNQTNMFLPFIFNFTKRTAHIYLPFYFAVHRLLVLELMYHKWLDLHVQKTWKWSERFNILYIIQLVCTNLLVM